MRHCEACDAEIPEGAWFSRRPDGVFCEACATGEPDYEAEGLRRQEDAIESAGDASTVTVGDEALEIIRAKVFAARAAARKGE